MIEIFVTIQERQFMDNKNYIEQINKIAHLLPASVLRDIDKRITDYLASGGGIEDNYIKQQLRFAENVKERIGKDGI